MPTEGPAKTNRETWLDWLPEGGRTPELLTRDEVIGRVRARDAEVSTSDLRYWEYAGVLPRPVRRWHQGATRAVYPDFAVSAIVEVRRLQDSRIPLDQIGQRVRERTRTIVFLTHGPPPSAEPSDEEIDQFTAAWVRHAHDDAIPTAALIDEVQRLAERRARLTGAPIERAELRLTDAHGKRVSYPLSIKPTESR